MGAGISQLIMNFFNLYKKVVLLKRLVLIYFKSFEKKIHKDKVLRKKRARKFYRWMRNGLLPKEADKCLCYVSHLVYVLRGKVRHIMLTPTVGCSGCFSFGLLMWPQMW